MAVQQETTKPITDFAPPPLSAVISVAAFVGLSIYYFPEISDIPPDLFVQRVFPEYLSIQALLIIRGFFTLVCFFGFASAWWTADIVCSTPYRPQSKVPRLPFTLNPLRKQYAFTSWSWNLLGISFALSNYVGYCESADKEVAPWLVRLALVLWEVTAPMTLLIGAVVKYALWPETLKQSGTGGIFLTYRALLQHNANVIMAMAELSLLGCLPVRLNHIGISVLYGCSYVLFTWAIQMEWHGQGPAFLYFFMDTTLGWEHTMALYVLLLVLMVFYGLFCGVEHVLEMLGGSLMGHFAFAFAVCALVCRFRD